MSKSYDIILYGASSYAAKYIIPNLENSKYKIALSGRNQQKFCYSSLPKIECSVNEIDIITSQTRILINCVGPYYKTAEEIISSCVKNKTHYIDICGEVGFIQNIIDKFDQLALENSIFILPACGFDSFIADIGNEHLKKQFDDEVQIESILTLEDCKVNITTWESLINSFGKKITLGGRKTKEIKFNSEMGTYIAKLRASDYFIVTRTQLLCKKIKCKYSQYLAYIKIGNFFYTCLYIIYGFLMAYLSKYECGRKLLMRYYKFFSHGFVVNKPTDEQIKKAKFHMLFTGVGIKNGEMISKNLEITGPDPGYVTMSIAVSISAFFLLDLLQKRDNGENISNLPGGVLTPGFLFRDCNYLEKFDSYGIRFKIFD